jgi:hypothetical protein
MFVSGGASVIWPRCCGGRAMAWPVHIASGVRPVRVTAGTRRRGGLKNLDIRTSGSLGISVLKAGFGTAHRTPDSPRKKRATGRRLHSVCGTLFAKPARSGRGSTLAIGLSRSTLLLVIVY